MGGAFRVGGWRGPDFKPAKAALCERSADFTDVHGARTGRPVPRQPALRDRARCISRLQQT